MGAIFQTTYSNVFLNENVVISIKISLRFIPKGAINNMYSSIGYDNGLAPTTYFHNPRTHFHSN